MKALDFFFNKLLPKKFIVFTIATIGLFLKLLDGMQWTIIAGVYLGLNMTGHAITAIKNREGDK